MCIKQKVLLLGEILQQQKNLLYSRFGFSLASEQHEQQVFSKPCVEEENIYLAELCLCVCVRVCVCVCVCV